MTLLRVGARGLVWLVPAAFLLLFFAYPVGNLLATALASGDRAAWSAVLSPALGGVVWFTVWQAALSTVLTVAVALPGAWVLGRFTFPGRSVVEALSVVAFVMPTVVVATAVAATLPDGADRGLGAILAAHVYFNVAVVLRMVGSFWAQLDRRPEQAAAALGAPPWRVFTAITWPRIRPVVLAAGSIVFLFTFTSFGIVLLLGGPGQATIEVEIQRQVLYLFNVPAGAALSLLQIVVVVAILIVQTRLARHSSPGDSGVRLLRRPRTVGERAAVVAFVVVGVLVLAGPVAMVIRRAFATGDGWGWANFQSLTTSREGSILFVPPAQAVANSIMFAVLATAIAMLIGGLVSVAIAGRVHPAATWEGLWLLPLGVSAVTLGFGILISFDTAPLNWRGSLVMVPIAQALVAIPFVVRALVPALRAVSPQVRQAAATLGASPRRVLWSIDLPLAGRALAVAAGFAFAISLGEFGATVFVARGDHPTVPIAIYRLLGTPGEANQGQAMALATILIALTTVAVLLTDRWRLPGERHV